MPHDDVLDEIVSCGACAPASSADHMPHDDVLDEIENVLQQQNLDRDEILFVLDVLMHKRAVETCEVFSTHFQNLPEPRRMYSLVCVYLVEYVLVGKDSQNEMMKMVQQKLRRWAPEAA